MDFMIIPAGHKIVEVGMLYDCRTSLMVPGLKLDYEYKTTSQGGTVKSEVLTEKDFLESTYTDLKHGSGSLNLGLYLSVGGESESFLKTASNSDKEKIFLHCKIVSRNEKAFFDPKGERSKKNRCIINYGLATHVVAAIEYGGEAVFEFEMKKINQERENTWGQNANFELVRSFASGSGKNDSLNRNIHSVTNTRINVTANCLIGKLPATFDECLDLYRNIGQHVGEGIPIILHLVPLSIFEAVIPEVTTLDHNLAGLALEATQTLKKQIFECKTYLSQEVVFGFEPFRVEVEAVMALASKWLERLSSKFAEAMVEGNHVERGNQLLHNAIEMHRSSPFQENQFDDYLMMISAWKCVLEECEKMRNSSRRIILYQNKKAAMDSIMEKNLVVCIVLLFPKKSQLQEDMSAAVKKRTKNPAKEALGYYNPVLPRDVKSLINLNENNTKKSEKKRPEACIVYLSRQRQPSNFLEHAIEVYNKGNLIPYHNVKLPFKVSGVYAENISDCSATIGWDGLGNHPNETYAVQINQENMQWHTIDKGQTSIHLNGLCSNKAYTVTSRLVADWIAHFKTQEIEEKKEKKTQEIDEKFFISEWSEPFQFKTKHPGPTLSERKDQKIGGTKTGENEDRNEVEITRGRFKIEWTKLENDYRYQVEINRGTDIMSKDHIKETTFEFTLEGNGIYQITLSAFDKEGICKEYFAPITITIENAHQLENLRAELKQNALVKSNKDKPTAYLLPMQDVMIKTRKGKQIGTFRPCMEERIVLVLGTSSEGRKRWMNMLVSNLLGVKAVHQYYFAMSMDNTAPAENTSFDGPAFFLYRICQVDGFSVPYTLTIIEAKYLPHEALKCRDLLHKHIRTIQDKLGPGFNHDITIVFESDLGNAEDIKTIVESKVDEITFHLAKYDNCDTELSKCLELLTFCRDTNCRKLQYRLWYACVQIQNTLISCFQRCRLLEDIKRNAPTKFAHYSLGPKYEKLLPGVKALNCMHCLTTCQPFCTDGEIADLKTCAVVSIKKDYPCSVCPTKCGINIHRLEDRLIVQKMQPTKAVSKDPGSAIEKALIKDDESFVKEIRNGLRNFKEIYPSKTAKEFCSHLLSHILEDDKDSKEECLNWIEKQMDDPEAMQLWEKQDDSNLGPGAYLSSVFTR